MLQAEPPPKAVKVIISKRVPLTGEELKAYEELQNRIKKEEALKASSAKEEDARSTLAGGDAVSDPMAIESGNGIASSEGIFVHFFSYELQTLNHGEGILPCARITSQAYKL
eukprot:Gb_40959 [translate_table: standard]